MVGGIFIVYVYVYVVFASLQFRAGSRVLEYCNLGLL